MAVAQTAALPDLLRADVFALAADIGERNVWCPDGLAAAAEHIEREFKAAGYEPLRQVFESQGRQVFNTEVELPGTSRRDEIVVVGAHYDTHRFGRGAGPGTPGADDNASGVAGLLALARAFAGKPRARTLRFVAFVNEEPPFFGTDDMGSLRYARRCRERDEKLSAVVVLEMIGCFTDERGSQRYPVPFMKWAFGDRGDFIAFLSNRGSRRLLRRAAAAFRRRSGFPLKTLWLPIPTVVRNGWSDDWSFWPQGYEAFAVTDTAYLRYPHYHQPTDTPEKLDYGRMAAVVEGLRLMIEDLADV